MDINSIAAQQSAAPASSSAFSGLAANFDTFLTLLTTQLQNQAPLDPLDTEQFTEQLVQFAGVEQSIETNANLETLIALQSSSDRAGALDLIGREVTLLSDAAFHGGDGASWTYEIPSAAANATFAVTDEAGTVVASGIAPSGGRITWNGRGPEGEAAAPGVYRLRIDARDAAGDALPVRIETQDHVAAVAFEEDGPRLETRAGRYSLDAVIRAAQYSE